MRINYEHDDGRCMTPCPYGIPWREAGQGEVILIGSNACAGCPHFVFNDEIEDWIECKYEEDIWMEAKQSLDKTKGNAI